MKKKSLRRGLMTSGLSILMMLGIMVGTSLAWFNVTFENQGARIQSGNLEVEFLAADNADFTDAVNLATSSVPVFQFGTSAQPGDSITKYLRVTNKGTIALDYEVLFRVVTDEGLGAAIDVTIKKGDSTSPFTGETVNNEKLEHTGEGMGKDDFEEYEITLTFNTSAGMEFQGKEYALDLLMVAWQYAYQDSKPVYVSTLTELQDAAESAKKGQTIVLLEDITGSSTDLTINQLVNLDLKGNTLTLNSLTVSSTDYGFMKFENGTINVGTYTIRTPNAELIHAEDFEVYADEASINTSGNSYILEGILSTRILTILGNTALKPQVDSELVVQETITKVEGSTATITPVSGALISVPVGQASAIQSTQGALIAQRVVKSGQSIQNAIDDASNGDTIYVEAGDYNELVEINKEIKLYGPNWNVDGKSANRLPEAKINAVAGETDHLIIDANNVEILGFYFERNYALVPINENVKAIYFIGDKGNNSIIKNNIINGYYQGYGSIYASGYVYENNAWKFSTETKGLVIENNLLSNGGYIYLQGTSATVKGNKITGARAGMQIQPYDNPNPGLVEGNEIESYRTGLWFNYAKLGAGTWTFEDNIIKATDINPGGSKGVWDGIVVQTYATEGTGNDPMVRILNNTIDGAGSQRITSGFRTTPNSSLSGKYDIQGNEFKNVQYGLNIYSLNTFSGNLEMIKTVNTFENYALASNFDVDRVVKQNESIQAAIDAAAPGDTIYIESGIYETALQISKTITLYGANWNKSSTALDRFPETIIKGQGTSPRPETIGLYTGADNVTISGFVIDNMNGSQTAIAPGGTTGFTLSNSIVINSARGIQGDFYGSPQNMTILNNTFESNVLRAIIGTEGSTNLTIKGNLIKATETGIGLGVGSSILDISGNTFENTRAFTIYETTLELDKITNNIINGSRYDGYIVVANSGISLQAIYQNNTFDANAKYGPIGESTVDLVADPSKLIEFTYDGVKFVPVN